MLRDAKVKIFNILFIYLLNKQFFFCCLFRKRKNENIEKTCNICEKIKKKLIHQTYKFLTR